MARIEGGAPPRQGPLAAHSKQRRVISKIRKSTAFDNEHFHWQNKTDASLHQASMRHDKISLGEHFTKDGIP